VTKERFFGIAPNHVKVKDTVSLFSSSKVPFLLRKYKLTDIRYQLVKECYVYKMIRKKAFKKKEISKIILY
jgi:hypothetical protein